MFKLFRYMTRTHVLYVILLTVFITAQVVLELTVPDYMADITKLLNTAGGDMSLIYRNGMMMVLFSLLAFASSIVARYFSSRLAASFSQHLRKLLFDRVEAFSLEEINSFSTASLITRSTNDCTQIQNVMSRAFNMVIRVPIMAGYALFKISTHYWQWTVFMAASLSIMVFLLIFLVIYAHPKFRKMQSFTDNLNQVSRENMTGMRVIRAYNAEGYEKEKFAKANSELTENALKARRAMGLMQPTTKFINNELNVGIYCIGAYLIQASTDNAVRLDIFSEMVVFSTYASRIVRAFMGLNMIFNMIPRASVSAERILEVLTREPKINDGTRTDSDEKGSLAFRNVTFTYPGNAAETLSDISFSARKGETVAFIGATGSGKSTLANLLMRFYDADKGEVIVDGHNVREYTQKALHEKMGYAPQQAILFTGTVSSNVAYARELIREKVKEAIRIAQAESFVNEMKDGIDAAITRGGTNVSGGQKQRISIARSIYRHPEFYIFDDTFSALDYKTDRILRKALKEETSGITTLIIAQRIGTIKDADKIIVLDEGRIIGQGRHEELMKTCDIYRDIARTQLSESEVA